MPTNFIAFYVLLPVALFAAELAYFRIAVRYNIIDKPNDRSSHIKPVIRGGGVIFVLAIWLWLFVDGASWPWFVLGLTLVSVISFMDDLSPQKPVVRFSFHLVAMLMLFYQVGLFAWPIWLIVVALIVCIGTINAFNFMDGINGITGVYALVCLGSFLYLNFFMISFASESLMTMSLIAIAVFLFFNFRKNAKCFAGDVGSVSLAFTIIFLLVQLIQQSGTFVWVLFLVVYGTDSVVTIVYRIRNRENIFKAHRSHLYQYMTNEFNIPHLYVSVFYGLAQLIVNILVISFFKTFTFGVVIFLGVFVALHIFIREWMLKRLGREGFFFKAISG